MESEAAPNEIVTILIKFYITNDLNISNKLVLFLNILMLSCVFSYNWNFGLNVKLKF